MRSVSTYIFNFEVAVKCDENYLGTARVQRCQKHGEPYKLSGCRVKMCTAPFDTTGYSVKEDSLAMHSFWVTARCSSGWFGTAAVKACSEPGTEYQLEGCHNDCFAPESTEGYEVKEKNLRIRSFDVEASCVRGYIGTASVLPCSAETRMYQLRGCQEDLRMCKASSNTQGYVIFERDLVVSIFNVSARCAEGWTSAPGEDVKVAPCTANNGLYHPSGCVPSKYCVSPNTVGYVVDEKQLLVSHFKVEVSCAAGYAGKPIASTCQDDGRPYALAGCAVDTNPCVAPSNTAGYIVKEHDLIKSTFNVEVSCAKGYTGDAIVEECPSPGSAYRLKGCI